MLDNGGGRKDGCGGAVKTSGNEKKDRVPTPDIRYGFAKCKLRMEWSQAEGYALIIQSMPEVYKAACDPKTGNYEACVAEDKANSLLRANSEHSPHQTSSAKCGPLRLLPNLANKDGEKLSNREMSDRIARDRQLQIDDGQVRRAEYRARVGEPDHDEAAEPKPVRAVIALGAITSNQVALLKKLSKDNPAHWTAVERFAKEHQRCLSHVQVSGGYANDQSARFDNRLPSLPSREPRAELIKAPTNGRVRSSS